MARPPRPRPDDVEHRITTDLPTFAIVPLWVLAANFDRAEWQVYVAMRSFASPDGLGGRAKRDTICERAEVSLATYKRARAGLEAKGAVTKTSRLRADGGFAGYDFDLPSKGPAVVVTPLVDVNEEARADLPEQDELEPAQVEPTGQSGGSPVEPGVGAHQLSPAPGSPVEPRPGSSGEPPKRSLELNRPCEQNLSFGEVGAQQSAARADRRAAGADRVRHLNRTARSARAEALVAAFAVEQRRPRSVLVALAHEVDSLIREGWTDEELAGALALWGTKGLHARTFASVADEYMNPRQAPARPSTTDQRVADAQALKQRYQSRVDNPPAPAPLRALEGGRAR